MPKQIGALLLRLLHVDFSLLSLVNFGTQLVILDTVPVNLVYIEEF